MKILALPLALAFLALAGCAAQSGADEKPTPTVAVATENEVSSVIAEYASDWQDTIDSAQECLVGYVIGTDSATEYVCQTREQTIGVTAGLVSRDLRKLNVPDSMSSLVDETDDVLTKISRTDLASLCGEDKWDVEREDCSTALGQRRAFYQQLDSKLAAWSPYL